MDGASYKALLIKPLNPKHLKTTKLLAAFLKLRHNALLCRLCSLQTSFNSIQFKFLLVVYVLCLKKIKKDFNAINAYKGVTSIKCTHARQVLESRVYTV